MLRPLIRITFHRESHEGHNIVPDGILALEYWSNIYSAKQFSINSAFWAFWSPLLLYAFQQMLKINLENIVKEMEHLFTMSKCPLFHKVFKM